jgi:hypothetical protein
VSSRSWTRRFAVRTGDRSTPVNPAEISVPFGVAVISRSLMIVGIVFESSD